MLVSALNAFSFAAGLKDPYGEYRMSPYPSLNHASPFRWGTWNEAANWIEVAGGSRMIVELTDSRRIPRRTSRVCIDKLRQRRHGIDAVFFILCRVLGAGVVRTRQHGEMPWQGRKRNVGAVSVGLGSPGTRQENSPRGGVERGTRDLEPGLAGPVGRPSGRRSRQKKQKRRDGICRLQCGGCGVWQVVGTCEKGAKRKGRSKEIVPETGTAKAACLEWCDKPSCYPKENHVSEEAYPSRAV